MADYFFRNKKEVLEFLESTRKYIDIGTPNKQLNKKLNMLNRLIREVSLRALPSFDENSEFGFKIKVSQLGLYLSLCKENEETNSTSDEKPYSFQIIRVYARTLTIEEFAQENELNPLSVRKYVEAGYFPYSRQVKKILWLIPEFSKPMKETGDGWFRVEDNITYETEDEKITFPVGSSIKFCLIGRVRDQSKPDKKSYKKRYNVIVELPTNENCTYNVSAADKKKLVLALIKEEACSFHTKGSNLIEWLYGL